MDDDRIWKFEESLWTADAEHYHRSIDDTCLMVIPTHPFILTGREAADAVSATPRWTEVLFRNTRVSRPYEGLIVIAYQVEARKPDADPYSANCSSTYRRLAHEEWRVIQHQQTPMLAAGSMTSPLA